MSRIEDDDATVYEVVVNDEEQYSIWPADRPAPLGWRTVGRQGAKPDCLAYIREVWTDMRPLSLRRAMDTQVDEAGSDDGTGFDPMDHTPTA